MARSEALSILISSIISAETTETECAIDSFTIFPYNSSLRFAVSTFESLTPLITTSGEKITAAATTGPARGPLPASSTPAISCIVFF